MRTAQQYSHYRVSQCSHRALFANSTSTAYAIYYGLSDRPQDSGPGRATARTAVQGPRPLILWPKVSTSGPPLGPPRSAASPPYDSDHEPGPNRYRTVVPCAFRHHDRRDSRHGDHCSSRPPTPLLRQPAPGPAGSAASHCSSARTRAAVVDRRHVCRTGPTPFPPCRYRVHRPDPVCWLHFYPPTAARVHGSTSARWSQHQHGDLFVMGLPASLSHTPADPWTGDCTPGMPQPTLTVVSTPAVA